MSRAAGKRLAPGVIVGWLQRDTVNFFLQRGLVLWVELLPSLPWGRDRGIRCTRCWSSGCDMTVHVLPIGSTQPCVTCSGRVTLRQNSGLVHTYQHEEERAAVVDVRAGT